MIKRKKILTIGGFDPSGGAGVLSDIKTFEQHKTYGMAVNTANTVQNVSEFEAVNWLYEELILAQLDVLLKKYTFEYVKIGLIPNLKFINQIHSKVKSQKSKIIFDPILKASAGFDMNHDLKELETVLSKLYIITPNWEEIKILSGEEGAIEGAKKLAKHCNVYLKGGHNTEDIGKDYLFLTNGEQWNFRSRAKKPTEKHGSGCIFSSALAANLAQEYPIRKACLRAKEYVSRVLDSNPSLLGYHK